MSVSRLPLSIPGLSPDALALLTSLGPDAHRPGGLLQVTGFAAILQRRGFREDAARVCLALREAAPDDPEIAARTQEILSQGVPRWHISLLHDRARAEAFDTALRRAIRPNMLVLDVGTGSGLLAMMAARAGAAAVVACEQDPVLALLAERNIRQNGYHDRVHVVAKHSRALTVGRELPRRADLLVSEIVANLLLGEGVLDAVVDARQRLLADDAPSIPAQGRVCVELVSGSLGDREPVHSVAGLDISAINVVAPWAQTVSRDTGLQALSDPVEFFVFDLSGRHATPPRKTSAPLKVRHPGLAVGLRAWMSIQLDDETELAGAAPDVSSWGQQFFRLRTPRVVVPGDHVDVHASHGHDALTLWAAG
jgi:hypothetical protein